MLSILFHEEPPSDVICTKPSSVPTTIKFSFNGDSERATIVP